MEQEKVNGNKEPCAEASSYRCSACHGDEDWGPGHPLRGRSKSRSLSAAPVLASAREFRYWPSGPVGALRRQEGVVLAGMASQRALPADPPPCPSSLWRLRCGGAVQCGPRPWARNGGGVAMLASVMRTSLKSRAKLSWPALPWVRGLRCFRVSSCATLLCQSPSGGRETLAAGSAGWGVPALSLQRTLNLVQWQRVRGGCSQRLTVMQT